MTSRRFATLAALALVAGLLGGCAGEPAPVETTPGFASEDEAFAAAEETYRAYVDALNQVDLSDPETFEPVFALTTGESNANERENLSSMHAKGWQVSGETAVTGFSEIAFDSATESVTAHVCTDVSTIALVDSNGVNQASPERPNGYTLEVKFAPAATETGMAIASSFAIAGVEC